MSTQHRYIALDTETTGIDFCSAQVIQCGVIFLDENIQETERVEWNVNYIPDMFSWNAESATIHKIPQEVAVAHGLSPEEFLTLFEKNIIRHYGLESEIHIIAANGYFDYVMLLHLWEKYRQEPFPLSFRIMDLNTLGLYLVGISSVSQLIEYFSIEVEESKRHSALYDAEIHLRLYEKMKALLPTVVNDSGV